MVPKVAHLFASATAGFASLRRGPSSARPGTEDAAMTLIAVMVCSARATAVAGKIHDQINNYIEREIPDLRHIIESTRTT